MSAKKGDTGALEVDWLGTCRRIVERLTELLEKTSTTRERGATVGRGAGGDETLVIDAAAEDLVFDELDSLHARGHSFTAISEERGEVAFGESANGVRIVIDPVDGSLNAKRLVPAYAVSVAVASGGTMEEVDFGYVYDFGNGEEFFARQGEGAMLDGEPLDPEDEGHGLELVGFEAARPGWVAPVAQRLERSVFKLRIAGSVAISLCNVAATRFDGMLTTNTCRSVDAAAAQLIAREAGAFVSVLGHGGLEAPLDLEARFRLVAARTPEGLETLVKALTDAGLPAEEGHPVVPS